MVCYHLLLWLGTERNYIEQKLATHEYFHHRSVVHRVTMCSHQRWQCHEWSVPELMSKLGLTMELYPNPYELLWVTSEKIAVVSRYKVNFNFIRSCKETVCLAYPLDSLAALGFLSKGFIWWIRQHSSIYAWRSQDGSWVNEIYFKFGQQFIERSTYGSLNVWVCSKGKIPVKQVPHL